MIKKTFNETIIDDIEQIENQSDLTEAIMSRIESKQVTIRKTVRHSGIFIFLILMLLTSTAYATVKVISIIELKNDENETIASIEVVDSDDNEHLDSHLDREALFRYGDSLRGSSKWMDKAFIVVDSQGKYPYNVDVRLRSDFYRSYSEIEDLEGIYMLPEMISTYKFDQASICYNSDFPNQEMVEKMIQNKENDERFLVSEIDTSSISSVSYTYEDHDTGYSYSVRIIKETESQFKTLNSNLISDYEIIMLEDIEALLINKTYLGVSYFSQETVEILGENFYTCVWYDDQEAVSISIRPFLQPESISEEIIDGQRTNIEIYPEDLKASVVSFCKALQRIMHEE